MPKLVALKAFMNCIITVIHNFNFRESTKFYNDYYLLYTGSGRIIVAGSLGNQTIPEGSALKLTCQVFKLTCQVFKLTCQVFKLTCQVFKLTYQVF